MGKMTKAQARRRLEEASIKVGKVWLEGNITLPLADMRRLVEIKIDLLKMANKLK